MSSRPHTPHPPVDELRGPWRVESASAGGRREVHGRTMVVWGLVLVHVATGASDALQCLSSRRTSYRPGQEIDGHVERRNGERWFVRDWPAVGDRRG